LRVFSRVVLMTAMITAGLIASGAVDAGSAAAYPFTNVELSGHGWGHGMGMGQWGAFGYSTQGWTFQQILSHYYGTLASGGSTTTGSLSPTADATDVRINMQQTDGIDTIVASDSPFSVGSVSFAPGQAAKFVPTDPSDPGTTFNVYKGAAGYCKQSTNPQNWVEMSENIVEPKAVPSIPAAFPANPNLATDVLNLCVSGNAEGMRGDIEATSYQGSLRTVDVVPLEQYIADVTPSESPSFWGTIGSTGAQGEPRGFQSLEAQAVAARSYVMSDLGGWGGYADTCNLDCQSYPGILYENPLTTLAVSDTKGLVVEMPGGAPATTFYSSSTGGYTVSSTYAAVPDAGDSVCVSADACNPHHDWTASIPVSAIQSEFPSIGTLESIDVTSRDGNGQWGGRVLEMSVVGSDGAVYMTGSNFADDFADYGVQSYWFEATNEPSGGIGGYWMAASDGGVFSFGNAVFHGSMGGRHLNEPIVGMAATSSHEGYWLVASDGGIFSFGDAQFYGSMGGRHLNKPIVGMAATPDGKGYWLVASDGGIFSFGDARYYGSMGDKHLNRPVVGMTSSSTGNGYWMVASDGGIFSFGDAKFHGSTGAMVLNEPIVGMGRNAAGTGYWLVAGDGGIFSFGAAAFQGSLPGLGISDHTVVGMLPTATGLGYLIVCGDGKAYAAGDSPQMGDVASAVPGYSGGVVAAASMPAPG
jgi:SpoIID/LytB domain protein